MFEGAFRVTALLGISLIQRRSFIVIVALGLLTGCANLHVAREDLSDVVWPTEGSSALRSNAVPTSIPPPLERIWDVSAGAGFGHVSPLVVGNVVLVATRKGEIHAFDMETGKRRGQGTFGESIDGTPTIDAGILYVPIDWGRSAVRAYDLRKGMTIWRRPGPPVNAGLIVHDNLVIAADVSGMVSALSTSDGEMVWSVKVSEHSGVHATPLLLGNLLVVCDDRGGITAMEVATGSVAWTTDIGDPVYATPAANDSLVFIPTTRGQFVALDPNLGDVRWTFDLTSDDVYISSPAVGEWEVIFGASDGWVRAIDPGTGDLLWQTELDGAVTAPPLITDGTIYVGTMRGRLFGLSRENGAVVWDTELDGRIKSPFAARGKDIVVLSEPRHVYLFRPGTEQYAQDRSE